MKIGVIGMGWVGSSVAISTLHSGVAQELLLNDIRGQVAEGEAMDLAHGSSFYPNAKVRAAEVEDMVDADAVVIAAGRGGEGDESRLSLLEGNAALARELGARLKNAKGLVIVVTNPVDVLTQLVTEASGLPPERVLGTGTMLDTARLRQMLGTELDLDPRSIHAHVIGEHGDSEVPVWSTATVGGVRLRNWPGWNRQKEERIGTQVRRAAYEIITRKGATNHAIGLVTANLLSWALRSGRRILTVTRVQTEILGLEGVALSLPTVVSREGAIQVLPPDLDAEEQAGLTRSADILRAAREKV